MLTPTGRTLATGGCVILVVALLLGNLPLAVAGAMPLFLAALPGAPPRIEAERRLGAARIERGGHVDVTFEARLPRGVGIVELHQALPEEFELVDGNNLHVVTLDAFRTREVRASFRVRVPKRGEYTLAPMTIRITHPLTLTGTPPRPTGEAALLAVLPRPIATAIPRGLRTRAKRPYPDGDAARDGLEGEEFKELREYMPGDTAKRINWKATARQLAFAEDARPLVNEVEREGKKAVYVLVDGHARLSAGTNLEDAREHAADAALSIAESYLRRNHAVGLALARSGEVPAERPLTGEAQVRRLRACLARLAPAPGPGLVEVLERDAALLHRARPLIVLVTRLTGDDADLEAAIRRISALTRRRGLVPGLVLDVQVVEPVDGKGVVDRATAAVLAAHRQRLATLARAAGLRVAPWRPGAEPLAIVMTREGLA